VGLVVCWGIDHGFHGWGRILLRSQGAFSVALRALEDRTAGQVGLGGGGRDAYVEDEIVALAFEFDAGAADLVRAAMDAHA
jgi:hypothetical protein